MTPTLFDGISVLYNDKEDIKVGAIVLFYHPSQKNLVLIKRCHKSKGDRFWVEGDNPSKSTDSRHFGWIDTNLYIGTVTSIL